jgi:hypothetical protein
MAAYGKCSSSYYTMNIPFQLTSQQSAFLALSRHFLPARAANVSSVLIRIGARPSGTAQQYPNRVLVERHTQGHFPKRDSGDCQLHNNFPCIDSQSKVLCTLRNTLCQSTDPTGKNSQLSGYKCGGGQFENRWHLLSIAIPESRT